MKKNLTKALLLTSLVSLPTFAEVDDYQKRSSQKYGNGTLKAIPEAIADITKHMGAEQEVEISYIDNDGQEVQKVLRYSVNAMIGENDIYGHRSERSGFLPISLSFTAEDGEGVSLEEAKLAWLQFQDHQSGFTTKIFEIAKENPEQFSTDAIEKVNAFNIIEVKLSDAVHTFENGNMIIFNGYAKAGFISDLKSYGTTEKSDFLDNNRIEYGSSVGVKFKDLIAGTDVTPEVFNRAAYFNDGTDLEVRKSGFQLSLDHAFSKKIACSAAVGFAVEDVEGQFVEETEEVYVSTKCEF